MSVSLPVWNSISAKAVRTVTSNSANTMCCSEPDDVSFMFEFVRMWSNYRIKRLLCGVRYAFYANVMLRLWRSRVTDCVIVSPRSQLHAVLTVAMAVEARSLMVSTAVDIPEVGSSRRGPIKTNSAFFLHFYFKGKHFVVFKKQTNFMTSNYNSANLCLPFCLSVFDPVLSLDFQENPLYGELQTRPMCCPEPDDVPWAPPSGK